MVTECLIEAAFIRINGDPENRFEAYHLLKRAAAIGTKSSDRAREDLSIVPGLFKKWSKWQSPD
jgi:hypothetical protein